jgi:hypothetical protein
MCFVNNNHTAFLKINKQIYCGTNSPRSYINRQTIPSIHAEHNVILCSPLVKKESWILQEWST